MAGSDLMPGWKFGQYVCRQQAIRIEPVAEYISYFL